MASQTTPQVARWALLLFDSDGCTHVEKTTSLEPSDQIRQSSVLKFPFGKEIYKVEILALADRKSDLDDIEREWQVSDRSDDIQEAKNRGQINGYLEIGTDRPTSPATEVGDILREALSSMSDDLGDLAGQDFHVPDIPSVYSEVEELKENQRILIGNQQQMMATQAMLVEGQASLKLTVQAICDLMKKKLQDAVEETIRSRVLPTPPTCTCSQPAPVQSPPVQSAPAPPTPPPVHSAEPATPASPIQSGQAPVPSLATVQPNALTDQLTSSPGVATDDEFDGVSEALALATTPEFTPPSQPLTSTSQVARHLDFSLPTQNINIGSIRQPIVVERRDFQKALKLNSAQRFILALMDAVFTNTEMAESSVFGGRMKYKGTEIVKKALCKTRMTAIFKQASIYFDRSADDLSCDQVIRNAINSKCRGKRVLV